MPQSRSRAGSGPVTRPTTDRVRESMFNVLSARCDFAGAHVLDLYAGSGALGIEALSRGAEAATFVESDRRAADVIAANLDDLGVGGASVRRATVEAFLAGTPARSVDLVFADPPYELAATEVAAMLVALGVRGWAGPGTVAVIERSAGGPPIEWPPDWAQWPRRRYGDTRLEMAEFGAAG